MRLNVDDKQLELPFGGDTAGSTAIPLNAAEAPPQPLPCRSQSMPQSIEVSTTQQRADALHRVLSDTTGVKIRLRITNNSSTMMSLRYEHVGGTALVGLHHMFLDAPDSIRKALGSWIVRPRAKVAGKKIDAFIAEQRHLIAARTPREIVLRTAGRYIDLVDLYTAVNAEEFEGSVTTPITWGRMPTRRRRRSIRFGSFAPGDDVIRIHPYLDQKFVPEFFIRYIVFHEMLHAHMGIEEGPTGRRRIHPPAFRQREAAYDDYERAVAWMEDESNLRRLLRAPKK
ncbi:MAG: hypothetical protein L3K26_07355 [Candidatus Hydrogenedentes bacterium]|nr:hypothetical protein [Candidatus Hydrogenedentota bacterium]